MRRILFPLLVLMGMLLCASCRAEAPDDGKAAWTVLVYCSGSNLESSGGLATANLEEISRVSPIPDMYSLFQKEAMQSATGEDVHILIETGGSKAWHTEERLGFSVSTEALQRYDYQPDQAQPFVLMEERPLDSMASSDTLSDFIRWGCETRPARRYALVLWGHGGGSYSGLLTDEIFSGAQMSLGDLNKALEDGGAYFDLVLLDNCLMANLEAAVALKDRAAWLVASEEIVAGKGCAYDVWLNELYIHPGCDGRRLARYICDSIQKKYADLGDEQASSILTFSTIDTARVDAAAAAFDAMFEWMGELYENYPIWFGRLMQVLSWAEEYGTGTEHMMDIGGMLTQLYSGALIDNDIRTALADALMDAVPYMVKGEGRSEAHGLSFCYAMSFSVEALDGYAENAFSAPYLALLDAVNPEWHAPDWVYERVRPLKPIETADDYTLRITETEADGIPTLKLENALSSLSSVRYLLYRYEEETGDILKLGQDVCELTADNTDTVACAMRLGDTWPAIDGELCEMDLVSRTASYYLYNIPILLLEKPCSLRAAFLLNDAGERSRRDWYLNPGELNEVTLNDMNKSGNFRFFGLWKGYNGDTLNASRDTQPVSMMQGREYHLLRAIYQEGLEGETYYEPGEPHSMPYAISIVEAPIPPGRYYTRFQITDIFGGKAYTELVPLDWDGRNWTRAATFYP